jgi:hypothetical protein
MLKRQKAAGGGGLRRERRDGFFLGNSSRPENWRLFLSSDMSRYIEFSKDDTIDARRLSTGRIAVWLRAGATVEDGVAEPMPEEFLRGEFQGYLGGLSGMGLRRLLLSEVGLCGSGSGGSGDGGTNAGTVAPQVTCPKPQCNDSIKDPGCK